MSGTRSNSSASSSNSNGIPGVTAAVAASSSAAAATAQAAPAGAPAPAIPPTIKGGGSTLERLNVRSNLVRLVNKCLMVSCQRFDADWATVLPELSSVATTIEITPANHVFSKILPDQVILVPCSAWFRSAQDIIIREATIVTFGEAYAPLCNADGSMPLAFLDKVGFYVFHIKSFENTTAGLGLPMVMKVMAVYIETLPPFIVDPLVPLCVGNNLLVPGITTELYFEMAAGHFVFIAKDDLAQQYVLDNAITLGKRAASAEDGPLMVRNASGFIQNTNDGKSVQRFSKDLHDKQLQLTHGFIRLLWSTPEKLDELFGNLDHRWDVDRIKKAVSSAFCSLSRQPHWNSISYYARIRDLRVMNDDNLLQAALCFKASAVDHRILGAGDFLPMSIKPDFSTDNHTLLFSAFSAFGLVLAVHIHKGYENVLYDTETFICSDVDVSVLPDYVLHMVFMLMLDSIGKDLNSMTVESGSALWRTDKNKGVQLIKDSAKMFFTHDLCLKVFDQWEYHYKDRHITWGSPPSNLKVSSAITPTAIKDPKDSAPKMDLTITRNSFCIRDVKFFYGFAQAGHPAVACSAASCPGKHIISTSPPKKDSVIQWLKDEGAQGGKVAPWKLTLVKFIQKK